MANFEQALERTLKWEGGYSNNPNDTGGETYCGISRKWWPNWEGWEILDEIHKLPDGIINIALDDQLRKDVEGLYYTNFWQPIRGDEIESQDIANHLFDFAVNSGIGDAVKALQKALNKTYSSEDNPALLVDGIIGRKTIGITNDAMEYDLEEIILSHMKTYRLYHILNEIGKGTIHPSFAKGLAHRAIA